MPTADRRTTHSSVTLDRREGPYGRSSCGSGGRLRDHRQRVLPDGHRRRALRAAADRCRTRRTACRADGSGSARRGLGVGFSLAHAAAEPRWGRIAVVEREQAIIDWHLDGPLARISGTALADPRTAILATDLVRYLRTTTDRYDALCLDIDNGPDWTVTEDNGSLYSASGLADCRERLNPGGVLAVWSAQPSAAFEQALQNAGFSGVRTEEVHVARGVPDVVHLALRNS